MHLSIQIKVHGLRKQEKHTIKIGASSEDIKQTSAFVLPKDIVTEKTHKVSVPQTQINELKSK